MPRGTASSTTHLGSGAEIAIIGGGIGGLASAIGLAKLGFRPTVFETRSEQQVRNEGAFLTIAPNGMNALRAIGLEELVEQRGQTTNAIVLHNERGRVIGRLDFRDHRIRYGAPTMTIGRGELASILVDSVLKHGIECRFNAPVTRVEQTQGEIKLAVGEAKLAYDAAIGADGIGSRLRQAAIRDAPAPLYSGAIGTGGMIDIPEVRHTRGELWMVFGARAFFGYLKHEGGPIFWFNSYQADRSATGPIMDPVQYARSIASLHADDPLDVPLIAASVGRIDHHYPLYDLDAFSPWWKGRLCLIGDAAHAVTPHSGLGASLALEDAAVLAALLARTSDWSDAFSCFEQLRRRRTGKALKLGRRSGSQKVASSWLEKCLRDLLLPWLIPLAAKEQSAQYCFRADLNPLTAPR